MNFNNPLYFWYFHQFLNNFLYYFFHLDIYIVSNLYFYWFLFKNRNLHYSFHFFYHFFYNFFLYNFLNYLGNFDNFLNYPRYSNNFLNLLFYFDNLGYFYHFLYYLIHLDTNFFNSVHNYWNFDYFLLNIFKRLWNLYVMVNYLLNLYYLRLFYDQRISHINLFHYGVLNFLDNWPLCVLRYHNYFLMDERNLNNLFNFSRDLLY